MRIGIFVTKFVPEHIGGAEIQAAQLAEHLAVRHDVTVFTRSAPGRKSMERMKGFSVRRRKFLNVKGLPRFASDIVSGVVSFAPYRTEIDVIFAYQIVTAGIIAGMVKRLFGIPYALFVRGEGEYRNYGGPRARFLPAALGAADRIVLQSETMMADFLGACSPFIEPEKAARKCRWIRNGVAGIEKISSGNRNSVVFIGRFIEDKAPERVVEVALRVRGMGLRDISWIMIGDGPERERVVRSAELNGLDMVFPGALPLDKLPGYLGEARCLILPSRFGEGTPNVILEAMSIGVPSVATDIGGVRDILEDGVTGFLAGVDDVNAMARSVASLFLDDGLFRKMSDACIERVKPYYWENVVGEYEIIASSMINR